MDSKIYKFCKSYEKRYKEYCIIFDKSNWNVSTTSDVALAWSNYLELSIESKGWNAFWNILRDQCEKLHVCFPKVVYVKVNDINFGSLTADVSLVDIDDEELDEFPQRILEVPLKDLYVTCEQENPDLDVETTAECLDQLRIFYHHLWWPWDDAGDTEYRNWVTYYLENRLKLYYDKLEGKVHYVSGKIIKHLIENSQDIYSKLREFCDGKSVFDVDERILHQSSLDITYINELYNELELNKSKLSQWEIAEVRKMSDDSIREIHKESGVFVVVKDCSMKDTAMYLRQVPNSDTCSIKIKGITNSLEDSLLNYSTEDTIFVSPGNHELAYREYFDFPVIIKGLCGDTEITISDKRSYWCIFESLATSVVIENIKFNLKFCHSAIIVKRGTLHLNSVTFENQNCKNSRAIYVYKSGTLLANKCTFSNFNIAVICMEGSTLQLSDCIFENNDSCIQIAERARITMNNCDLSKSKGVPFKYEETALEKQYESLSYLSKIECVNFNKVRVADESNAVEFI